MDRSRVTKYLTAIFVLGGTFAMTRLSERWGWDWVPDGVWYVIAAISASYLLWQVITHNDAKAFFQWSKIHKKMSLAIYICIGSVVGAALGCAVWVIVQKLSAVRPIPAPQQTMQAGLRSYLIPANDSTPKFEGFSYDPSMKLAIVGNMITAFPDDLNSFTLIQIGGKDVLSVEWNAPEAIVINAKLYGEHNELLATIDKNVFHSYAPNDYDIKSDNSTILILNSKDEVVLFVRYMNSRTIKVNGRFSYPSHSKVIVEDGVCTIGEARISGVIYSKAAGGNHWYSLEAVLVAP